MKETLYLGFDESLLLLEGSPFSLLPLLGTHPRSQHLYFLNNLCAQLHVMATAPRLQRQSTKLQRMTAMRETADVEAVGRDHSFALFHKYKK